jgi:plasmid stabilization system protein ParE
MIRWTERAVADLIAIGEYIAVDNPGAARRWVERLRYQAELAAEAPLGGRSCTAWMLMGSPCSQCSKGIASFVRETSTKIEVTGPLRRIPTPSPPV